MFIAAAIILVVGGLFTMILFFSRWFSHCSNWKVMKWTKNSKCTQFIDAYHAPFTPKHCYWMGLLLLVLIVHNVTAALSVDTFLPVLSAGSLSVGLITLKHFNIRVYKKWSKDFLEDLFLLNLAIFTYCVFYAGDDIHRRRALANVSMAIAFVLFVIIMCHHFFKYILAKTSIWPKMLLLKSSLKNSIAGLKLRLAENGQEAYRLVADEQIEDDKVMDYNSERADIVNPPFTDVGKEEADFNKYHAPPNIIPATRSDQLREPDFDKPALIITDDYQSAPSLPRPQVNNNQGVTDIVRDPEAAV